ncbi:MULTISPECIES: hypothetical protein [Methylomonas]|jgi:hypothetical protein|uniref:ABC transporter substrate-binding protein n=2 Tax=Methylomonas TaxID=416 RepID=A0A177MLS6_METMH|nr:MULTISPECIES: hypothetical protein [Methylomonas]MBD9363826.1 hypothetical protein [Methylomonas fluvii]OAI06738.1 hypothetical protein A1332_10785 [Methylomonas methanica]CAD6877139.1 hypothetical protein [Methylomonas fluvii]
MRKEIYNLLKSSIIFFSCSTFAKDPQVVIVYSAEALGNPAYAQVIAGIEHMNSHVQRIESTGDNNNISSILDATHADRVIALGKGIVENIYRTEYRERTLAGLMYFNPAEYSGVGLALDNRVLVEHLARLLPSVKHFFVVQQSHFQTIDYVPNNLKSSAVIEIREGVDSLDTIRVLGRLLDEATSADAIFIPANLPKNILYEVAKVAWDKKIILLSTNLSHLENGALIAAYPDDFALGEQLGRLVSRPSPVYENIKVIKFALNRRVAQHLAIEFDPIVLDSFALKIK